MKKCEDSQEMISAYVDGELVDAETSKLFFHLGECSNCRSFMKSILQLRSALQEIELPAQISSTQTIPVWNRTFSISYAVAAAALVVMLSSVFFFNRVSQQPIVIEKVQTEYVYMTPFPTVYAQVASAEDIKPN